MDVLIKCKRWDWRTALLLVGVVRAGVLIGLGDFQADPDAYHRLAGNLVEQGRYGYWLEQIFPRRVEAEASEFVPTAYRPPLYPLLLAVVSSPAGIAVLHWGLGMATVLLAGWMVAKYLDPRWAWLGISVVGLDPILLNQSTQIMTETLAATLVTGCWVWAARAGNSGLGGFVLGILWGVTTLCRPAFLAIAGLVLVVRWWFGKELFWHWLAISVLGLTVCLAPWVIRNAVVLERLSPTTTHGGYTFHLANNAEYYQHLRRQSWWQQWRADAFNQEYHQRRWETWQTLQKSGETARWETVCDRREWRLGVTAVQADPSGFGMAAWHRVLKFWGLLPQQRNEQESLRRFALRYLIAAWYALVFLSAIGGLIRLRTEFLQPPWVTGLAIVIGLTLVHTCFWSDLRMRAPLMPIVGVFATIGLTAIWPASRVLRGTS